MLSLPSMPLLVPMNLLPCPFHTPERSKGKQLFYFYLFFYWNCILHKLHHESIGPRPGHNLSDRLCSEDSLPSTISSLASLHYFHFFGNELFPTGFLVPVYSNKIGLGHPIISLSPIIYDSHSSCGGGIDSAVWVYIAPSDPYATNSLRKLTKYLCHPRHR